MKKEKSNDLKPIGNEKSYTKEFFDTLYDKISLTDSKNKAVLRRTIILATQAYLRNYAEYLGQLASHEIEKELKKVVNHIDKATESLIRIYASGNYGEDIVNNLYEVISKKYPSLHGILKEIKRGDGYTSCKFNSFLLIKLPKHFYIFFAMCFAILHTPKAIKRIPALISSSASVGVIIRFQNARNNKNHKKRFSTVSLIVHFMPPFL